MAGLPSLGAVFRGTALLVLHLVAVAAVLSLLLGSVTGLVVGRWQVVLALAAAIAPVALLTGPAAVALGALGAAGFLAGVQLHRVVADGY
jgi:hypothetical protein